MEQSEGVRPQSRAQFGRNALGYGAFLLFPTLLFGALLAVQLGHNASTGWLAVVAGCAGVMLALYVPSPRRRRASTAQFIEQQDPAERARWEELLIVRARARRAILLVPPAFCLLAVLAFTVAGSPWRDPTLGDGIAVAVLGAAAFGIQTWALQWLVIGWEARQLT